MTLATRRLFAGVLLAGLLLGAAVHAVAAVDSPTASDTVPSESATDSSTSEASPTSNALAATELLTLDFSVKRLLVSLGFVGALVARRQGRGA